MPARPYTLPPSVELAQLPTPLVRLRHLSEELGLDLRCKRDDLTGAALSGNKVRKLEFLFAAALEAGARAVVTCGGEQSNHARATALGAARLGLKCHLLLRTADPTSPPAPTANILLDRLAGATIEWITPAEYADRDARLAEAAERVGGPCYVIPEGGSDEVGAWGYVRCAEEIADQLGDGPATIVYAVGSGGTAAGLIAGFSLLDRPYRLIGVCVADDRPTFQARIADILARMAERFAVDVSLEPEGVEIWDGYVGRGYALSRDEELRCIADVARREGLVTDPVYSGKALFGLLSEIRGGRRVGDRVVFLHTGGIFGLFPKAEQLAPLL